jgi:hypothetical protein
MQAVQAKLVSIPVAAGISNNMIPRAVETKLKNNG